LQQIILSFVTYRWLNVVSGRNSTALRMFAHCVIPPD
jgi:hypothetical protein